jgi:hypothetical protein
MGFEVRVFYVDQGGTALRVGKAQPLRCFVLPGYPDACLPVATQLDLRDRNAGGQGLRLPKMLAAVF